MKYTSVLTKIRSLIGSSTRISKECTDLWSPKATLAIEVSGICNMRCPMCSYPSIKRKKGFMQWNLFEKIVHDVAENGHSVASLHYFGEPLMWPHIVDGIKLLAQHRVFPRISTNGMLLSRDMAKRLQDAGAREIMVTLDTLRSDVYQKIRTGGNFEIVKMNIHQALQAAPGLTISVQLMPTKYNENETEEDFYREFGRQNNFRVEPWFVIRMNRGENISRALTHKPSDVDKRLCDKPFDRVDVLWDGTTVLCCLDSEGDLVTGNLNENSISYSWMGPKAMELRWKILRGEWKSLKTCRQCTADHIAMSREKWQLTDPLMPLTPEFQRKLQEINMLDVFDESTGCWTKKEASAK